MNTLAIEINDAELIVADRSGVLAAEPGYAALIDGEIVAGAKACAQARLRPRQTSHRYWDELSREPDSAGIEGLGSSAELAFAQMDALWKRFGGAGTDAVLVIPGHYTREQLGLLLGIVQACGMPVRAMIDAAAAASTRPHPGCQLTYLDAGLHRVSAMRLRQGEDVAADPEQQTLNGVGLASLMDLWAKRVAEAFVLQTRFDPFHRADTEQLIYDRLPAWLAALRRDGDAEFELVLGEEKRSVRLRRDQWLSVAAGVYRAVVQLVAQCREPGASLVVQVSHRLLDLPGLETELQRLDDARIVPMARGAAVLGALACLDDLDSGAGPVKLLRRLPWRREAVEEAVDVDLTAPERPQPPVGAIVRDTAPTHVVHRGVAHPVGRSALHIGREAVNGRRTLVVDDRHQAVSRAHCELVRRDGELRLMDRSRFGTFVNEKRISGETALRPADVIRIGSPGEEMQVITVVEPDGS